MTTMATFRFVDVNFAASERARVALSKGYFVLSVAQTCLCHAPGIFQRYFDDRRELDTRRRARAVGTTKSERSSPVDVGLSKIYSFSTTRDCLPL